MCLFIYKIILEVYAYLLIKRTNGVKYGNIMGCIIVILNVISKYLADRYLNNNALIKARIVATVLIQCVFIYF